ncbi:MAG TPA: hypothetical protein VFK02_08475 [Kofleriaceae bacterium]|nr:hypothetical protein [Kofleriaceae bacterium]
MLVPAVATVMATFACGGSPAPIAPHPRGYAAHMEAAEAHSERAEEHRQAAAGKLPDTRAGAPSGYQCGDSVMSDQLTSGGERVVESIPCWDTGEERAEHERYLAEREQRLARTERRTATRLVEAELAACHGLAPRELEHSPFAHRREIAAVIPHRVTGTLRGVRVVWKPVLGLTAGWMRQAIACHRARFERLGEPTVYLPEDPTLVARASVTVEERGDHLEVLIDTADDAAGRVALDRALDLVRPQTAVR